jgi:hypothetical protein
MPLLARGNIIWLEHPWRDGLGCARGAAASALRRWEASPPQRYADRELALPSAAATGYPESVI